MLSVCHFGVLEIQTFNYLYGSEDKCASPEHDINMISTVGKELVRDQLWFRNG